ncbi:MAG: hypothetical protein IT164_18660 [Bryobacterales bacterium]|nr:hypothetical protein [Bryobacterales bacterium]
MQIAKWVLAPALLLALTGCGSVKIRQLVHNPGRYQNRTVRIAGNVTRSTGALVAGAYQVDDGTGKITVLSMRPIPPRGASVRVKGEFNSGLQILNRSFGNVIREQDVHVVR